MAPLARLIRLPLCPPESANPYGGRDMSDGLVDWFWGLFIVTILGLSCLAAVAEVHEARLDALEQCETVDG